MCKRLFSWSKNKSHDLKARQGFGRHRSLSVTAGRGLLSYAGKFSGSGNERCSIRPSLLALDLQGGRIPAWLGWAIWKHFRKTEVPLADLNFQEHLSAARCRAGRARGSHRTRHERAPPGLLRQSWLTGKSKEWCFTLSFSLGTETQGKKRFYHLLPLPSSSTGTSTTPRAALVLCVPPWLSKANAGSWDGATALCEEHGSHCCNKGAGKVNTCFYFAGNMLEYSFCHSYLTYFASKERIARAFWNKLFLV